MKNTMCVRVLRGIYYLSHAAHLMFSDRPAYALAHDISANESDCEWPCGKEGGGEIVATHVMTVTV